MWWHLYCLEAKVRRFWSAFTWKVVFNYILLFKWHLLELEIITSQLLKISKISHTKSPKIATKIMVNIGSKDITTACKWMTVTAWKVSKYGVFFGPYFPVFLHPYLDTFHAVILTYIYNNDIFFILTYAFVLCHFYLRLKSVPNTWTRIFNLRWKYQ